MVFRT